MLAKAGLNSAGVGVTVNMLQTDRDGGTGGVPYHVLVRYVLDQPEGFSHSALVTRLPRNASINLIVATAGGTAINLELAPRVVGLLTATDGLLAHANHFVTDALIGTDVHDEVLHLGGSSLYRDARVRELLAAAAAERRVSIADLERALTDHVGFPLSVCRHLDTTELRQLQVITASSVIMDLDAGELRYSDGPPCGTGWSTLRLAEVFASGGAAEPAQAVSSAQLRPNPA